MWNNVQACLDSAMEFIASPSQVEKVLAAQRIYQDLTGLIDQDSEDYEFRMHCFYEWLLFHYQSHNDQPALIVQRATDTELASAFEKVNYGVFEYLGLNFSKQVVFKDLLHNKKIFLAKDHRPMEMIKGDIFIGRSLVYLQQDYLLYGILLLPLEIKRKLVRELKKVRKLTNGKDVENFLLLLEQLRNRWHHYPHVEANRFFDFSAQKTAK